MNVDELSRSLANHLAYLQLMASLEPGEGNITNPTIKDGLNGALDFYKTTNEDGLLSKAPKLIKSFQPLIERFKSIAPLKVSLDQVATDFNSLFANNKEVYSYGIEYGWLHERMDCSRMGLPKDLPWHTRIGIGLHAGRISVEELFLLHDAFFMLASAEETFANMNEVADKIGKQPKANLGLNELYLANSNVAAYSRLCVVSFYSFIEAFVNSVGYDFYLQNQSSLSSSEIEILRGKKKGSFVSLEYKIEKFPSIIRVDKKSPIITLDSAQIKEPFRSFVQRIKQIRDASVHFAPSKEEIWRKPLDWLENARSASNLCTEVAKKFWKACYPDRNQPKYLENLEYAQLLESAKSRMKAKNDIFMSLRDNQEEADKSKGT
jgi:hypothetical protein